MLLENEQNELLGKVAIAATFNITYHPIQLDVPLALSSSEQNDHTLADITRTSQIRNQYSEYAESENNICGGATCFGGEVCSKSFRLVGYIDWVYLIRWITLKKQKWCDPDGKEVSE